MTNEQLQAIRARNEERKARMAPEGSWCSCCRDEMEEAAPDIEALLAEVARLQEELDDYESEAKHRAFERDLNDRS